MKRFLVLFTGKTSTPKELSADQLTALIASWDQWCQDIGPALVDKGTGFADRAEIIEGGEVVEPMHMNGYVIIQAEDLGQALDLALTHPYLSNPFKATRGKLSMSTYELMTEPAATYAQAQPNAIPTAQPVPTGATLPPPVPPVAQPQSPQTPTQPATTLPPPADEEAVPQPTPGELTIPHETPETEQTPPPANPPTPGQPSA